MHARTHVSPQHTRGDRLQRYRQSGAYVLAKTTAPATLSLNVNVTQLLPTLGFGGLLTRRCGHPLQSRAHAGLRRASECVRMRGVWVCGFVVVQVYGQVYNACLCACVGVWMHGCVGIWVGGCVRCDPNCTYLR